MLLSNLVPRSGELFEKLTGQWIAQTAKLYLQFSPCVLGSCEYGEVIKCLLSHFCFIFNFFPGRKTDIGNSIYACLTDIVTFFPFHCAGDGT
jgi:hypothetical protein